MKPNTITMAPTYFLTGENKMITETKKIKSDLWEVYHKLEEAGASKTVKYAIIDVMILMDKEAEKKEEVEC